MLPKMRKSKQLWKESELRQLTSEEEILSTAIKGLRIERTGLMRKLKDKRSALVKKEDLGAAADFKIAELEREIAILTGGMSPENR